VGPVIDHAAQEKILRAIEAGRSQSRQSLAMDVPAEFRAGPPAGRGLSEGLRWVGPHIFTGVKPDHTIARDEIFGPVLAVMHARSFDEALELANASPYKLTGGVFSRKPANLARARREFRVGNLYLNRGITGALVGRQPFGGFGLSGTGSKAGGREYLLHFTEPRAVCENTMRRGFAPEV
jgi:RHH-type proline utilization regulon transcriptional repressor/proline dehydrogenase/delta 1-pyrroline-5-carboxylate dehydrogenase